MAINFRSNVSLNKAELQNAALHKLGSAPSSPVTGQVYFDTGVNKFYGWNGSGWIALDSQGTTAPNATTTAVGLIQLAGDLGGSGTSATAPVITAGAIDAGKINASLKPSGTAAAGTEALRALGTTASTAAAGNDSRLSDARTPTAHAASHAPAGSDALPWSVIHGYAVTGSKPAAATTNLGYLFFDTTLGTLQRSNGTTYDTFAFTDAAIAAANKDGAAGTPSLRTLGTGATQAVSGTDSRLSDTRTPSPNSVTSATIVDGTIVAGDIANATITDVQVAAANKDGVAGTASLRTLGTGAQQAAAGNDSRFHTQNTDTGTSNSTFFLVGTTASDVRIKKTATGELSARLGDDSGFANFQAQNVTVNGNLTVNGTTTTLNSNTLSIGDNIIVLNNDVTTTALTTENAGLDIQRFTGANVSQNVSNFWDETGKRWSYTFPASSGTATVSKPSAIKHVEVLGAITGGTAVTVTHGLNTRDVAISVRDTTTNELVFVDAIANSVDTVQLTFASSFGAGAFNATVVG